MVEVRVLRHPDYETMGEWAWGCVLIRKKGKCREGVGVGDLRRKGHRPLSSKTILLADGKLWNVSRINQRSRAGQKRSQRDSDITWGEQAGPNIFGYVTARTHT